MTPRFHQVRQASFPMKASCLPSSHQKKQDCFVSRNSTTQQAIVVQTPCFPSHWKKRLHLPFSLPSFRFRRNCHLSRGVSLVTHVPIPSLSPPIPVRVPSNIRFVDSLPAVDRRYSVSFAEDSRLSPHAPLFSPREDRFATGGEIGGNRG